MATKDDTKSEEFETSLDDSYFQARDQQHKDAKVAVASCIVENFLTEGDSILLDAGTSLYPIAEIIAQKAKSEPGLTHFTIMTQPVSPE